MILIIDHYDSFIDMIADYVKSLDFDYELVKTDSAKLHQINLANYSHIIIGPGPGHPQDSSLSIIDSIIDQAIKHNIPLLGICLGHQLIGQYFGARVVTAKFIAHGIVDKISIVNSSKLFIGLPNSFNVTRYHSLIIDNQGLPECIQITTLTDKEEIMSINHKNYSIYGVQFHPESIMTQFGHEILLNFLIS